MKRALVLLLAFVICLFLCSCKSVSYNDGDTEMYYNGNTYINYNNTNGKYRFEPEEDTDNWIKIDTKPYGIFVILGAVTRYYGNDYENPDFITNSRTIDFYVREDISLNDDSKLFIKDSDKPLSFSVSEVTTGETIEYSYDNHKNGAYVNLGDFDAVYEDFPMVEIWFQLYEVNGCVYIQDAVFADLQKVTEEFEKELYNLGLISKKD
ncbi:MAG: hypothetical protein IJZ75_01215 [Clostridia bacterium]|nr:hypothetical protein [Clostridia bacterium]